MRDLGVALDHFEIVPKRTSHRCPPNAPARSAAEQNRALAQAPGGSGVAP